MNGCLLHGRQETGGRQVQVRWCESAGRGHLERDVLGLLFFDILHGTGEGAYAFRGGAPFASCDGWGRRSATAGFSVRWFLGLGLHIRREWRGGVRRPWVGGERLVELRARLAPDRHSGCEALHYGRARGAGVLGLKDSGSRLGTVALGRIRELESRE